MVNDLQRESQEASKRAFSAAHSRCSSSRPG